MKYLLYLLILSVALPACNCEEPPFLSLPESPPKVLLPEPLEGGPVTDITASNRIIIGFRFSQPMNTQTVVLYDNLRIYTEDPFSELQGSLSWPRPDSMVFTSVSEVYGNANLCPFGCFIRVFMFTGDVGVKIRGVNELVLDGDCDGEPEGTYETSLFAD